MISFKQIGSEARRLGRLEADARRVVRETIELAAAVYDRPRLRGECEPCPVCQAARDAEGPLPSRLPCGHREDQVIWHSRPCVMVACRANLYLDVTDHGSIKLTRPELEPDEMEVERSCVIDVAGNGSLTLEETGEVIDVSRERIRQLETMAMMSFKVNGGAKLRDD